MQSPDIFHWANRTDAIKNELDIELFLFNKNFMPYSTRIGSTLGNVINQLFLFDLINFINLGAGTGLQVRELDKAEKDPSILPHISLGLVGRAETLLHLIENERQDIVEFNHDEHDFKRVKGIAARFTHPSDKDVKFYVVKHISPSTVSSGVTAWQFNQGEFSSQMIDASLKMPADNQVLIVGGDIFVFNQAKFSKLFNFDARQIALANEKGAAIDKHYKLSFPDLIHEISFACTKASTMKKLLAVDTDNLMSQEQVLQTADEMQIELMTDDKGAIIIMDDNDAGTFLDIVNDNYVRGMTGQSYLAKSKKSLELAEESK